MTEETRILHGAELAKQIADEEVGLFRILKGPTRFAVPAIAIAWCLFQLSVASWLTLDSLYVRSIHLAFGLAIAFLSFPAVRRAKRGTWAWTIAPLDKIPIFDWALAALGVLSALYVIIDYDGMALRMGSPLPRDIFLGVALLLFLLEASRRVVGPAFPCIMIVFSLYAFFGPYMPSFLAFRGVSLNRYLGQITMSTEGIYGIPLDVSSQIVFLFVLFGAMLDRAGAGRYFINLALSLLGGFKGGPAKACIVGSWFVGLISGSSIGNVVTAGTFTIPLMKSVGYPAKKAAGLEVAASIDGQICPPVMGAAAFIMAEYLNLPYLDVALAASIPAFVSYGTLFYIAHIEASKLGLRGLPREELPRFIPTLLSGLHYLIPVAVLVYELVVPRHSPQLAAFRAIVTTLVLMFVQEAVRAARAKTSITAGLRKAFGILIEAMVGGSRNMVSVAIACAAAGVVVGIVTMGLGGIITEIIEILSMGNIYLLLFITMIASILLGMGIPTTATYIVTASLVAPAIVSVGAAHGFQIPLIAAHLFCFYFGMLADDTPPVGLASYAAAAIAHSEFIPTGLQGFAYHIRTAILPFMFIFNTDMLLIGITNIPQAIFIYVMTCVGGFAFASATQGYFVSKNQWHEVPLFLLVTGLMMRPGYFAEMAGLPHDQRYWMYAVGLAVAAGIFFAQRHRAAPPPRFSPDLAL